MIKGQGYSLYSRLSLNPSISINFFYIVNDRVNLLLMFLIPQIYSLFSIDHALK